MVPEPGFTTLLIQSGAEAGMVGGLADWFAVTALFRHPLGLPIPHTAIIPSNKDRIGRTLGRFVERNFLTSEALTSKLRQMQVGQRVAAWLAGGVADELCLALDRESPAGYGTESPYSAPAGRNETGPPGLRFCDRSGAARSRRA